MRRVPFLFLSLAMVAPSAAQQAAAPTIFEHDAVTCMTTKDFPVIEAIVNPAESGMLRKAQTYFKAGTSQEWYFVDMEPVDESRYRAILPMPLPETGRVDYYLLFLTGSFDTSQTEERSARVSESGCVGISRAAGSSPVLTLQATVANQPPIPPGFQPQGISSLITTSGSTVSASSAAAGAGASGGGLSGATIGVIAGGGAAAAGAAVAVSGGGGDSEESAIPGTSAAGGGGEPSQGTTTSSGSPGPSAPPESPSPSPSPPSVRDLSGTWLLSNRIQETCYPPDLGRVSDRLMAIEQNGMQLSATFIETPNVGNFTGTIDSAGQVRLSGRVHDEEGEDWDVTLTGTTTTGDDMTGTYDQIHVGEPCVVRGTFTGDKR